ncbi:MAG: alanine:cation symporter family protein [Lentisphaeraceae bacterium]|nr:alanine:cation symporter family protein [Lentisphaeraceae bacterium]
MYSGLLRTACSTLLFLLTFTPLHTFAQESEKEAENKVEEVKKEASEAVKPEKTLLSKVNDHIGGSLFFDVAGGSIQVDNIDTDGNPVDPTKPKKTIELPFLVVFLALGSIYFTFFYRFINFRYLKHSFDVIRGKYDNPDDQGEISHFKALTSALSATIGLGNIAGVAIAIQMGGPGAVFWMVSMALFGMCAKFNSATLAQYFRKENSDGSISGGPMYYLELGLKEKGKSFAALGLGLGILYAICLMAGSIGGGNMFQGNQALGAVAYSLRKMGASPEFVKSTTFIYLFGVILAGSAAAVILGGIKRIGNATSKIVPIMCGAYILASLYIILSNAGEIGSSFGLIFSSAFSAQAAFGGFFGVLMKGVLRAAFSNEAGLGSASIAHAAAKTDEPVREGIVAMIGPIIDTVVVCTMTALVVIITQKWNISVDSSGETLQAGAIMTLDAFGSTISWFPYILTLCILLFAFSTMISWCYYGERGWIYLADKFTNNNGVKSVIVFRIIFVVFIFLGVISNNGDVITFSELMILSMAFPNILGSIFLAPFVWKKTTEYLSRYKAGEFKTFK